MQALWRAFKTPYPRQFWLMFVGMFISTVGSSMIWPFLMIYISERLHLPLTSAAGLITLNAAVGLGASFIAGPIVDYLGRKWVMVISLVMNGMGYVLMSQAQSYSAFAGLMALQGFFNPLYRIGADAMMADLIPAEHRAEAYSMLRLSNNLGVAIGPAVGGFIASLSYSIAFLCAATGMSLYGLLIALRARETLPRRHGREATGREAVDPLPRERFGGYGRVLRDRAFLAFVFTFTLTQISAAILWVLLSVYTKQNFGLPESRYGWIPTTNALMVVFFQIPVTLITKRFAPLPVLAIGSLFYASAVTSIAWGRDFWAFWLSMVVMTIGELILIPTSTTYVAGRAPEDMRGRYMSIYGLTWGVASGIGPVLGGLLNDHLGPQYIWYGGGLIGFMGVILFLVLSRVNPTTSPTYTTPESAPTQAEPEAALEREG